ncbi:hypothetical protein MBORA_00090 [Methanobrevibacter oralis]|uniref:Uncharacterized protein n=3 Tax=Methanobrevibacter oralis TaxID=66851 RepID=A0A166CDM0_METOA|nr:hypothetical protein MBORA_00090 [Methanobrevibacter oralis]
MKNKAIELRKRGWDSLRNLSWIFNVFNSIDMSYETIRKSLLTFDGLYYVNTDMKFSGYAAYDCTVDYELSENGIIDIYYLI